MDDVGFFVVVGIVFVVVVVGGGGGGIVIGDGDGFRGEVGFAYLILRLGAWVS